MNAIIVHGASGKKEYYDPKRPSLSNSHWFPWIQKQLLIHGVSAQTPEFPDPYNPRYDLWKKELERYEIGEDTILVGHSCGGGFLLRWMSENRVKIGKLILVAPWIDPEGKLNTNFFDFTFDTYLSQRAQVHLLYSTDDKENIQTSVAIIKDAIRNIHMHTFKDRGHFTYGSLKSEKFPELLKIILS